MANEKPEQVAEGFTSQPSTGGHPRLTALHSQIPQQRLVQRVTVQIETIKGNWRLCLLWID